MSRDREGAVHGLESSGNLNDREWRRDGYAARISDALAIRSIPFGTVSGGGENRSSGRKGRGHQPGPGDANSQKRRLTKGKAPLLLCPFSMNLPCRLRRYWASSISLAILQASHPATQAHSSPAGVATFEDLRTLAESTARRAHVPREVTLDPFFRALDYDGHRQIQFRQEQALYKDGRGSFIVEFFHPGWMFQKEIRCFNVRPDGTRPFAFDPDLFTYGELKPGPGVKPPTGYSGFRIATPLNDSGEQREFMVFLGASYFRVTTGELLYGISGRGVAVNTVGGLPEEFPDFTHFWMKSPKPGDEEFVLLALLDGPSLTGAYQFTVRPGQSVTRTRVKATLFLRKPVGMLGIAPFSSMFWFGEITHPRPYDFRPEVHDSDGLEIEMEGAPPLWRPLDNTPGQTRLSFFQADHLKGFGMAERDREFQNFEDLEAKYHRRPGTWVTPVSGFGKGSVALIELSTGEETWDNVVCFWSPEKLPSTPDEPITFEYDIDWLEQRPAGALARVTATRRGFATETVDHLYVIDYAPIELNPAADEGWMPETDLKITGGEVTILDHRAMKNPQTGGWRAFFKLDVPEETKLLEMSLDLLRDGEPIAERWIYQWRR